MRLLLPHRQRGHFFFTPHFHAHFDINHLSDALDLRMYLEFISLQLGFTIHLNNSGDQLFEVLPWDPNLTFYCKTDHSLWETKECPKKEGDDHEKMRGCKWMVKYRRVDPYDEKSRYVLVGYNPVHEHPLHLRFITKFYSHADNQKYCKLFLDDPVVDFFGNKSTSINTKITSPIKPKQEDSLALHFDFI